MGGGYMAASLKAANTLPLLNNYDAEYKPCTHYRQCLLVVRRFTLTNDKRPRLHLLPEMGNGSRRGLWFAVAIVVSRWRSTAWWRGLSEHAAPFVEAAGTGVAEVTVTEEPPQALWHGIKQPGQVLSRLEYLSRPPDADDAADYRQQDHAVDHIQEGRACATGPRIGGGASARMAERLTCISCKTCFTAIKTLLPLAVLAIPAVLSRRHKPIGAAQSRRRPSLVG